MGEVAESSPPAAPTAAVVLMTQTPMLDKCHPTSIKTKNGKVVLSDCNKMLWSKDDYNNDQKHITRYFYISMPVSKKLRIFYVVIKFCSLLLSKIKNRRCVLEADSYNLIGRASCYLSHEIVCTMLSSNALTNTHSSQCGRVENNRRQMNNRRQIYLSSPNQITIWLFTSLFAKLNYMPF